MDGSWRVLTNCDLGHGWGFWQNLVWVLVESSDRTWSTGEGNGKTLQYSCLKNPMNSMKRQKDDMGRPAHQVARCPPTGEEQRNSSRKNEDNGPKQKRHSVLDVPGGESNVWCCKEQCCIGPWNVRSMVKVYDRSMLGLWLGLCWLNIKSN